MFQSNSVVPTVFKENVSVSIIVRQLLPLLEDRYTEVHTVYIFLLFIVPYLYLLLTKPSVLNSQICFCYYEEGRIDFRDLIIIILNIDQCILIFNSCDRFTACFLLISRPVYVKFGRHYNHNINYSLPDVKSEDLYFAV